MMAYDQISERYFQMLETDPVHNYVQMQQEYQKLKDLYFKYMEQQAEEMTQGYTDLHARVDAVKTEADKYPREWNTRLYSKIDDKVNLCKKFVVSKVDIPDYEIRCRRSGLQLRDIYFRTFLLISAHYTPNGSHSHECKFISVADIAFCNLR